MKKRLFISIAIPASFKKEFLEWERRFAAGGKVSGVQWTKPENMHITAYFIGGVDEKHIPELAGALEALCTETQSFELAFETISFAPPKSRNPSMLWGVFKENGYFAAFSQSAREMCERVLEKHVSDMKEPIPHVTLARIKNFAKIRAFKLDQPEIREKIFTVSSCELIESVSTDDGVSYAAMGTFLFRQQ